MRTYLKNTTIEDEDEHEDGVGQHSAASYSSSFSSALSRAQ
jgi:hypothetical protein